MTELLEDESCRKRLADHCVYDFWLRVLNDSEEWRKLLRPDRLLVDQCLLQLFQFAIRHGFGELVSYLWDLLTPGQQETVGFLNWKKVCWKAEHHELIKFLCVRLCKLNPNGMARITWDSFYDKIFQTLKGDELCACDQKENMRKLECLLECFCDTLRANMLSRENYRAITETFMYQRPEAFKLVLEHLDPKDLSKAREFVDRIYDRRKNKDFQNLRKVVIRKQMTFDGGS
ncbi:Protein T12A7.6 [Aphelenchoides avenae]|nr:Protein T12A7.6 [Aphelenchus avenae]